MSDLVLKIRRRLLRLANRFNKPNKAQSAELFKLISEPPSVRTELDAWTANVQTLIQALILDRITKEDIAAILTGIISYRSTGITPEKTQLALVRSYENSSGLFQEVLHKVLFEKVTGESEPICSALFGTISADQIDDILVGLRETGYAVLPIKLDISKIEQLKSESLSFDYQLKGDTPLASKEVSGIDLSKPPACISAYAKPNSVKSNSLLQEINRDELFKKVCSSYLGTPAAAIDSTFWYTFPSDRPSSETAQLFHYDLDTIRWVKVFIYLNDVDANNGPHEYVATSHKPGNKPAELLVRGYARIDDSEIDNFYAGKRRSITGSAGTVVFGDTRCFHKGNAVNKGHRLIYSPIYAPSRIGYFHG